MKIGLLEKLAPTKRSLPITGLENEPRLTNLPNLIIRLIQSRVLLIDRTIFFIYTQSVKTFSWNREKNEKLKETRGITFGEIVDALLENGLLEIVAHPNREKYPNQKILVVLVRDYCYLVPFIETEEEIFLKTIVPSRKYTKKYIKGGNDG